MADTVANVAAVYAARRNGIVHENITVAGFDYAMNEVDDRQVGLVPIKRPHEALGMS